MKYLVCWKRLIAENNMWEKKEDLKKEQKQRLDNKKRQEKKFRKSMEGEVQIQRSLGKMSY